MTFLNWKKTGLPTDMEWVNRVTTKGTIWASPGEYLERNMLQRVARVISDFYLPEALLGHTTYEDPEAKEEEEEGIALGLAVRLKNQESNVRAEQARDKDDDEDDEDEYDEDEDEEDDAQP